MAGAQTARVDAPVRPARIGRICHPLALVPGSLPAYIWLGIGAQYCQQGSDPFAGRSAGSARRPLAGSRYRARTLQRGNRTPVLGASALAANLGRGANRRVSGVYELFLFSLVSTSGPATPPQWKLEAGFWLTAGALLLSALGLLLPDPWWWIKVQPAPHAPGASASRRHLLSRALNLGGILLVGCAAGLDLGWLTRPRMTPLRVLSIGVFEIPFNEGMNALVWSPDGAALLECLSGVLRSWEMATGQVTRTYFSPFPPPITGRNPFGSIALSPNGRLLAAAMEDGVLLWEVTGGRLVQRLALSQQELLLSLFYSGVTWSPDGTLLATTRFVSENQAALFVLRASDLKQQARYPLSDISQTVAWSPDGRMLALVSLLPGPVEVWDISHGRKIWTYQPPRFSETTDLEGEISTDTFSMQATDIAWAPDSRRLAISLSAGAPSDGFRDQQAPVLIWDIVANHLLGSYQGHWGSAHGLAWAPDGTRLAAAGQDWTVQVWHAETGR